MATAPATAHLGHCRPQLALLPRRLIPPCFGPQQLLLQQQRSGCGRSGWLLLLVLLLLLRRCRRSFSDVEHQGDAAGCLLFFFRH